MTFREFFDAIGISIPDAIAGFMGGLARALVVRSAKPFDVIASVIVGAISSSYLAPLARSTLGIDSGAVAFLIGLTAMILCQVVLEQGPQWWGRFIEKATPK